MLGSEDSMKKILFVCHGNICRSPMAEFVMKDLIRRAGREKEFVIASAATSTEELGNPVYPPARAELMRHGLSADGKYAVRLTREDYGRYDLLIGMDDANIANMLRLFGGDPDGKICKLLSFAGDDRNVADPWYTGRFDVTYRDVLTGCESLLKHFRR